MRFLSSSVFAVAAALVASSTVENHVIGPFALRITGKQDSAIDGYAWACHAGAAIEGLCYVAGSSAVEGDVYEFYYNYTLHDGIVYPGAISYEFLFGGGEDDQAQAASLPSFLRLYPNWASNVHIALLPPSTAEGTIFSLDFDTGFFYMGDIVDDTHFYNATPPAPPGQPGTGTHSNISNFHICYQWTGGYWLRSLAWVAGLEGYPPQNPSCEPVNLGVESLGPEKIDFF
ncbi:hypothetical protein F5Y17DRAFT_471153 [Xylariaceae sp. FL0594]|nr:hypothetical protein F5Y17DRAFT_471153 [Xylariaceae sp. FL0594]